MYYSNRSAALLALGKHRDALADGKKCVDLRPAWAKGYARVGAAFSALEQFTEVLTCCMLHCIRGTRYGPTQSPSVCAKQFYPGP